MLYYIFQTSIYYSNRRTQNIDVHYVSRQYMYNVPVDYQSGDGCIEKACIKVEESGANAQTNCTTNYIGMYLKIFF